MLDVFRRSKTVGATVFDGHALMAALFM